MGTRFLCTVESPIHQRIKEQIVANDELATDLIMRTLTNTTRVARNTVSQEVLAIERKGGATIDDIKHLVAGVRGGTVYEGGDQNSGIWSTGMVQGLIHDIPNCADLVARIMAEASEIVAARLNSMMGRRVP
jgi:nitronate monooxygenase